ncbi:MAG: ATP-binding protein [Bacillota bacterium]|nr:ATP-binding protein [Bacillota bacterium]
MIKRDIYLNRLIASKDNGIPKIITGIRRCGKSYLLKEIYRDYLIKNGVSENHILILELDDDRNALLRDPINLGKYIRDYCKEKSRYYIVLDEIQKVYTIINPALTEGKHIIADKASGETISFVDVVLGLSREPNIDLYVTGSNSHMLSTDIITEFRDKAENINLAPLSFSEYYEYVGGSANDAVNEYLLYGGMPLAVLKPEDEKRTYLSGLFATTYFKDIIERNNLRKTESLDELCRILSVATGSPLNAEKIANTYESVRHEKIDKQTVEKYIACFNESFLLRQASRYDVKGRKEIGALRKYYFTDVGLRNAILNFAYSDEGILLENAVYNELIFNGYTVNVGIFDSIEKNKDGKSVRKSYEIDFYAVKGNRKYYIQVADNISDVKTKERETRPYSLVSDNITKVIVLNKSIKETLDDNNYVIIGAADFLLRYI